MAIKQDNNRNEARPETGDGNRLPDLREIEARDFGTAGQRVILDRALQAVDGFGAAQFEAAGTSVRELVDERETVIRLLARVVRFDGRRASRQRHRSAALRLLGHLQATGESELIARIVEAPEEPVTVRAAAFDALGMLGDRSAAELVSRYVDDPDERIAARALWSLGRLGDRGHLVDLERRLDRHQSATLGDATVDAVGTLGVRLGIPVAIPERDRRKPQRQRTREADADESS
jgi:hypothetical protein